MIHKFKYIVLSTLLISLTNCNDTEDDGSPEFTPSEIAIKVMPLGASRVEGARPNFESYRYELWKLMIAANWDIDLVGTMEEEASYPSFNGFGFDNDHEGRGGWTSGEILSGISEWLNAVATPDIVLISSPGGNDALTNLSYDQAVSNVNAIIDILQAANPNITIVIEQMASATSSIMTTELRAFMEQMNEEVTEIATEKSNVNSEVLTVDMSTGFQDNMLADDVHYNEEGAQFIAERYFEVLSEIIQN